MVINKVLLGVCCAMLIGIGGCSRQQSDWEKTRTANTTDSYELFIKKYPSGEFTAQAQARAKELYEERDWQKARDTDTADAYQAFLKQYPDGKWTEEARIRVENFTLAQAPSGSGAATPATGADAGTPASPAGGDATEKPPNAPAATAPAATPQPASRTVAAKSAKASSKTTGHYGIQLGAFKSSAGAAHKRWAHLEKENPKLLAGLTPKVSPKKGASGTLYRLQVVGLSEKRAHAICKSLAAKSQACVMVSPTRH